MKRHFSGNPFTLSMKATIMIQALKMNPMFA